jgi:hypothetical protein
MVDTQYLKAANSPAVFDTRYLLQALASAVFDTRYLSALVKVAYSSYPESIFAGGAAMVDTQYLRVVIRSLVILYQYQKIAALVAFSR